MGLRIHLVNLATFDVCVSVLSVVFFLLGNDFSTKFLKYSDSLCPLWYPYDYLWQIPYFSICISSSIRLFKSNFANKRTVIRHVSFILSLFLLLLLLLLWGIHFSSHSPIIYASIYTSLHPANWRASTPIHIAKHFFFKESTKKSILIGITDVSKSIVLLDVMFFFHFYLICVIRVERLLFEKRYAMKKYFFKVNSINDIIFRSAKSFCNPK